MSDSAVRHATMCGWLTVLTGLVLANTVNPALMGMVLIGIGFAINMTILASGLFLLWRERRNDGYRR